MKKFDTQKLEQILKSRFFINQTAQIYGGVAGLYDMGPVLFTIKQNFFTEWRKHFISYDNIYEIDTSILLPRNVLKASGHVDKFCDILITDTVTKASYRADHYLEAYFMKHKHSTDKHVSDKLVSDKLVSDKHSSDKLVSDDFINKIDCMNCTEIDEVIRKFNIKSPDNNEFSPATNFNLMFETILGGQSVFLRPETAQGQFLNFKKLYEFNNKKMPFGSATIGRAFRNEISPRSGLIRTREFEQAEIEYFVKSSDKSCKKFSEVSNIIVPLLYNDKQELVSLKYAVSKKIIDNEILAYFIGSDNIRRMRWHTTLRIVGTVKFSRSYGWIECVGIADRSAYDLTCHGKASNIDLSFSEKCCPSLLIKKWMSIIEKRKLIKIFKSEYDVFKSEVEALDIENMKIKLDNSYYIEYKGHKIEVQEVTDTIHEIKSIPDVIEPSFGVGRILYILLEHSFYLRECGRPVLGLRPILSNLKVVISYVQYNSEYDSIINKLTKKLYDMNLKAEVNDRSCSIGKKYSSCDEIGIPFFITFDIDSLSDNKVTIRERDSMGQVRVDIERVCEIIERLVSGRVRWEEVMTENIKI